MLARRLTTILPDMTLAQAIDTTRIYRVAGLTGRRTAVITAWPFRTPTSPWPLWGWWGAAKCRCRARCRWRTMGSSASMNSQSSGGMCLKCCGNR
jgi:hypothetical protein